jgi:hypothetical protein
MDKKINNKILIIAITILGIAAVTILGYFLYLRYSLKKTSPSTEETTNITNSTSTFSSEDINKILEKISAPATTSSLTNGLETKNNSIPDDKLRIIKQKLSAPKGSSVTIPKEILDKLSAPK